MKVRVGMEASGHARWFERVLSELHFELWIGDAAEIRTKRVRKQKTDRQDVKARRQEESAIWLQVESVAPTFFAKSARIKRGEPESRLGPGPPPRSP